jgi:hypothetical protein
VRIQQSDERFGTVIKTLARIVLVVDALGPVWGGKVRVDGLEPKSENLSFLVQIHLRFGSPATQPAASAHPSWTLLSLG